MLLGEYINQFREKNHLSMKEFADLCGLSKGYISMLENNFKPSNTGKNITPSINVIKKLAIGMNVDFDILLSMINGDVSLVDNEIDISDELSYDNIFRIEKKKFPMLGTVACGEPIFADENRESYIMAGTDINADFCLKCKGDSMINARIYDGDIVFIKKQPMVDNGEIAVVIIGDEVTLKRVYYYREQNFLLLKAENPKFKDLEYREEEIDTIRILGKAVAFQGDVI